MRIPDRCPIENSLKYITGKWTTEILRDLFMGAKRFKDFLARNKNLSTRILSLRLREMEEHGLITRTIISESPVRIEYNLTQKGRNLGPVLTELAKFTLLHERDLIYDEAPPRNPTALVNYSMETFKP